MATDSAGPFRDASVGPLVFQRERGGSIDLSSFFDADGRVYLIWKSDDNALGRSSSLWAQGFGLDLGALVGAPTELFRYDRGWERLLIEAFAMVCHDGRYYFFYSANWWESVGYAVGYAVVDLVLGPFWKETTKGPWLASGGTVAGFGGQEFFIDAGGGLRMAYYAWSFGMVGY